MTEADRGEWLLAVWLLASQAGRPGHESHGDCGWSGMGWFVGTVIGRRPTPDGLLAYGGRPAALSWRTAFFLWGGIQGGMGLCRLTDEKI